MKCSIVYFVLMVFIIVQTASGQNKIVKKEKPNSVDKSDWKPIFNGKDLDGWIPKVTGYKVGENPLNGFRVEDGILKVDYSKFAAFNGRFGHLFYKEKLSSYVLRVEYRFVGELLPDAPSYCFRNSGVMVHSQSPESMDVTLNWPVSLEAQLLGSTEIVKQTTANICTPGTTVFFNNLASKEHCINSTSKYYKNGEWVTLEIIVHGGKEIYHVIDGDTVLAYSKPQIGGFLLPENYPLGEGILLEDGYIALQAEGQPIDFRKVELKILDKKNKKASNINKKENQKSIINSNKINDINPCLKVVDNFDAYPSNKDLSVKWYTPGHGGKLSQSLDSIVKGGGKYSLKCEYTAEKSDANFYCPICRVSKWDLSGCNGVQFWFKPDGSGREMTFELNIANKDGKNIHDLWGYKYLTEKGDTTARIVTIPFFNLVHNTKFADAPDVSDTFKPESVIEVAIYISGRNDEPGSGIYYFDEIYGAKLQF